MTTVEQMHVTNDISAFRTHRYSTNIALHYTAAGDGHAFVVASVLRASCYLYLNQFSE
jgi:hypothetical protein